MDEQLLIFELAEEAYGLAVNQIQTVIPRQTIVPVPNAPAFVAGLINLRGSIIPVVDLRRRFNMPPSAQAYKSVIIVTVLDGLKTGLLVDSVTEVIRIGAEAIEPPSALLANLESAYLRGIGRLADRPIMLLDLLQLFASDERQALARTTLVA